MYSHFLLHSGPVTAGVLRGDRARFQLFGDTVNTTSRIETTGQKNKIHVSQETADLLIAANKEHWIRAREDKVVAKGKGELQTYWLEIGDSIGNRSNKETTSDSGDATTNHDVVMNVDVARMPVEDPVVKTMSQKQERLVEWNTEVMAKLLRDVVARRLAVNPGPPEDLSLVEAEQLAMKSQPLDEVVELIRLPNFDAGSEGAGADSIRLDDVVVSQLRDYIRSVASM